MNASKFIKEQGFTIVELLIVIVVIAILASASIVSYGGIRLRAGEAQLKTDIRVVKNALEMYKVDNNAYPSCPSGGNCWLHDLGPMLVPKYISTLTPYYFGYAYYSGIPDSWAMEYRAGDPPYNIPTTCKFGVNMPPEWYSSAPECK